jgi:hypothetical protein
MNLVLAFVLEIGLLAALAFAGYSVLAPIGIRIIAAIGFPAAAATAWGVFAAPKSAKRLSLNPLFLFKVFMFAVGAAALIVAGQKALGALFGGLAALHLVLASFWKQV